jgi:DNA adenine methylase
VGEVSTTPQSPSSGQERYPSPLRYPGGKGKVVNFIKMLVAQNELKRLTYVEPYAGGASVALSLLFEGYADKIHINDLNEGVYSFWSLALNSPDELCRRIRSVDLTVDEWRNQKAIYANPLSSDADRGFATFYLNRTNRSGIINRGGVIGGLQQTGNWKIDARFNRESLCDRVKRVAERRDQITVTKMDAVELIKATTTRSKRHLLYLDPPYYVKGARLYDNAYAHDDHVKVRDAVSKLKTNWVVSYDAAPEVLRLYSAHPKLTYTLGYSASTAASGSEVMFFSSGLTIPSVKSPASVSNSEVNQVQLAIG